MHGPAESPTNETAGTLTRFDWIDGIVWLEGTALLSAAVVGTVLDIPFGAGRLLVPAYWPAALLLVSGRLRGRGRPQWHTWALVGHLLVLLLPVLAMMAHSIEESLVPMPPSPPRSGPNYGGGLAAAFLLLVLGILYLPLLVMSLFGLWRLWKTRVAGWSWRSDATTVWVAAAALLIGLALHLVPPVVARAAELAELAEESESAARTAEALIAQGRNRTDAAWEEQVRRAGPNIIPHLLQPLDDADPLARRIAAHALTVAADRRVWPLPAESLILRMHTHLSDPDPQVRADLVRAIDRHADKAIETSLQYAGDDALPQESRRFFAEQMARANVPRNALRDAAPQVRAVAFAVLVAPEKNTRDTETLPQYLTTPESAPVIAEQLAGPHRAAALAALKALRPAADETLPHLRAAAEAAESEKLKQAYQEAIRLLEADADERRVSRNAVNHFRRCILHDVVRVAVFLRLEDPLCRVARNARASRPSKAAGSPAASSGSAARAAAGSSRQTRAGSRSPPRRDASSTASCSNA